MNEKGRTAGARQGRSDFAADMPGFAHAENHDPALAMEHEIASMDKVAVNTALQLFNSLSFNHQNLAGQTFQLIGVHVLVEIRFSYPVISAKSTCFHSDPEALSKNRGGHGRP